MKNKLVRILTLTICLGFITPAVQADSWWQKATGIFSFFLGGSNDAEPGIKEISSAFKQALEIGSQDVTKKLSAPNGFNQDPIVHIPLPEQLEPVRNLLAKVGLSGPVDTLEMKLNSAAEAAAPQAGKLFKKVIAEMTFEDVMAIYNGPPDSATQYFREKMSPELMKEMTPVVTDSLNKVGAIQSFNTVMDKYHSLPFAPQVDSDLSGHVVDRSINGIFHYMAQEEQAIREDPVRQTTALLKRVFGRRTP